MSREPECQLCPSCGMCQTPHAYSEMMAFRVDSAPTRAPLVECQCPPPAPDRTECCGAPFDGPCRTSCINFHQPDVHARLDRYIEAILGGRLRFQFDGQHVYGDQPDSDPGYWINVFRRWQQLYVTGRNAS
jgi:hypothetical protein